MLLWTRDITLPRILQCFVSQFTVIGVLACAIIVKAGTPLPPSGAPLGRGGRDLVGCVGFAVTARGATISMKTKILGASGSTDIAEGARKGKAGPQSRTEGGPRGSKDPLTKGYRNHGSSNAAANKAESFSGGTEKTFRGGETSSEDDFESEDDRIWFEDWLYLTPRLTSKERDIDDILRQYFFFEGRSQIKSPIQDKRKRFRPPKRP